MAKKLTKKKSTANAAPAIKGVKLARKKKRAKKIVALSGFKRFK